MGAVNLASQNEGQPKASNNNNNVDSVELNKAV